MPALYMIHQFVDASLHTVDEIVGGAVKGLERGGCWYGGATVSKALDASLPPGQQQFVPDLVARPLSEARRLAAEDLRAWINGSNVGQFIPLVELTFLCDFEFDSLPDSGRVPPEAKEVHLCFWYFPGHVSGTNAVCVDLDAWEEYVLMYGREETHRRNMMRILSFTKAVYEEVHPYFGFLNSEVVGDESSEILAQGLLPTANQYLLLGPQTKRRFSDQSLLDAGRPLTRLLDGGVMLG